MKKQSLRIGVFIFFLPLFYTPVFAAQTSVRVWGCPISGILVELTKVTAIAVGEYGGAGLKDDSTIACWGAWTNLSPGGVQASNVVAIAAGPTHLLALKEDGTVLAWGDNSDGQCTVPAEVTNAVAIAAGMYHSLALLNNGHVLGWGDVQYNFPADLTNAVAITADVVLKADGSVFVNPVLEWLETNTTPTLTNVVPSLTNIVSIAVGYGHCIALRSDGTVAVFGGRFGGGTSPPPDLSNVVHVAAGLEYSVVQKEDSTLAAWGANGTGQSPHCGQTLIPPGLSNIVQLNAGWAMAGVLTGELLESNPSPRLESAILLNETFTIRTQTKRGWNYRLEYQTSLPDGSWTMLPPVPGDGEVKTLRDSNVGNDQRFYRVRVYR